MAKNKIWLAIFKLFFAGLGISAVITEIITLVGRGTFNPANFFSFFTIESNIFAAAVFAISAASLFLKRPPSWLPVVRGASALYMITTGVVFAFLLSGLDVDVLTAVPWDNMVLHYIIPVAVVVDWLIDPPKAAIGFRRALIWLAYPLVYVTYSLIRGHAVGWYPYPFLSPEKHGYAGVAVVCIGVTLTVLAISWLISGIKAKAAPR